MIADSAQIARELFLLTRHDLLGAISRSRNARRLLSLPELRPDVDYCLQRDCFPLVASLGKDGLIKRQK
jgi:phosphosulfolactate phosphohydrolase-like enzyme